MASVQDPNYSNTNVFQNLHQAGHSDFYHHAGMSSQTLV